MTDLVTDRDRPGVPGKPTFSGSSGPSRPPGQRAPDRYPSDSALAAEVKALVGRGELDQARDRFAEIVPGRQRRASRLAWHLLRDGAEADEAVQDAFIKAFTHIRSFQEDLSFEVWFTRILVNTCLDRRKARRRRERWLVPAIGARDRARVEGATVRGPSAEALVLGRELGKQIATAVERLPERQRAAFVLCHYDGRSTRETAALLGLSEPTVRVHLFRAIHKLRTLLEGINVR